MPATSVLALPYPATTDPADVPADIKKLADRIEALSAAPLSYQEVTANTTIAGTTEPTATIVVASAAVTLDGSTAITVEFFAPRVEPNIGVNNTVYIALFDGSTSIGNMCSIQTPAGSPGALGMPVRLERKLTPSAGAHTYSFRAYANAGGFVYANVGGAGAYVPGFIRVRRA